MLSLPGRAERAMLHGSGIQVGAAVREPRSGKSFRAAADRIVRQESEIPSVVTRLLGPPWAARPPSADEDPWNARLAALAALGQYDGLAVVAEHPVVLVRGHNVNDDRLRDPAFRALLDEARRTPQAAQIRALVQLADGRTADAMLLVPLFADETVGGVLIALRVGRSFAAGDAITAQGVAELATLELSRLIASRREDVDRHQALALYELGRLALFGEEQDETLQSAVTLVADTLGHDAAHLWVPLSGGWLQLRAAHPQEALPLGFVRPADHRVLAEALRDRRVVNVQEAAAGSWVPRDAKAIIVVPLRDGTRTLGLLILGRAREAYRREDEEFADVLGTFLARLIIAAAREQPRQAVDIQEAPRDSQSLTDSEGERELTRS
jgi:GAF domain-containing protein